MPDHTDLAVALWLAGRQRPLHGVADGMELVVAGEDLDDSLPSVAEHGEIAHEGEEPPLLEHTLDEGFQFRRSLRRNIVAFYSAPGHEALEIGRQRPDARPKTVRDNERRVGAEQ